MCFFKSIFLSFCLLCVFFLLYFFIFSVFNTFCFSYFLCFCLSICLSEFTSLFKSYCLIHFSLLFVFVVCFKVNYNTDATSIATSNVNTIQECQLNCLTADACNSWSYALFTINNADNCALYSALFTTTSSRAVTQDPRILGLDPSFTNSAFSGSTTAIIVSGARTCLQQDQVSTALSPQFDVKM
jgi:hypothetical protein